MEHELRTAPVHVLIVEDNPDDVDLTMEALRDAKLRVKTSVVEDGEEAMRFLRREGEFAHADRPDLILLDLNLPKKDGREILKEIKQDPGLKRIPVAVLTTSSDEADIVRAYDLHANCYLTKPIDFPEFIKVVKLFEEFWLTMVKLPPSSGDTGPA